MKYLNLVGLLVTKAPVPCSVIESFISDGFITGELAVELTVKAGCGESLSLQLMLSSLRPST